MLKRRVSKDVEKAMEKMPDKQFCQIYDAIKSLCTHPEPGDSKELKGNTFPGRRRKDCGEYRIIYWYDDKTLYVDIVGKRNDDAAYKIAKRKGLI